MPVQTSAEIVRTAVNKRLRREEAAQTGAHSSAGHHPYASSHDPRSPRQPSRTQMSQRQEDNNNNILLSVEPSIWPPQMSTGTMPTPYAMPTPSTRQTYSSMSNGNSSSAPSVTPSYGRSLPDQIPSSIFNQTSPFFEPRRPPQTPQYPSPQPPPLSQPRNLNSIAEDPFNLVAIQQTHPSPSQGYGRPSPSEAQPSYVPTSSSRPASYPHPGSSSSHRPQSQPDVQPRRGPIAAAATPLHPSSPQRQQSPALSPLSRLSEQAIDFSRNAASSTAQKASRISKRNARLPEPEDEEGKAALAKKRKVDRNKQRKHRNIKRNDVEDMEGELQRLRGIVQNLSGDSGDGGG